jgi:hypothetical protein
MGRLLHPWYPTLVIAMVAFATPAAGAVDDEPVTRASSGHAAKCNTDDVTASTSAENGAAGGDAASGPTTWPCRVGATADVQPFVQRAWEGSATFREQCRKLAAAGAVVSLGSSSAREVWNAASHIGRSSEGVMVARVRVRIGAGTVELIAHELEHVLERIEGVNYLMASRRGSSTRLLPGGAFETKRAIEAGRRVAREMEQVTRRRAQTRQ